MNVIRLQSGYKIKCNDSEFEALNLMVKSGAAVVNHSNHDKLSKSAKAAIRRAPFTDVMGGPLAVTDDRRGTKSGSTADED